VVTANFFEMMATQRMAGLRRPLGRNRSGPGAPTTTEERLKTSAPVIPGWHIRAFARAIFTTFKRVVMKNYQKSNVNNHRPGPTVGGRSQRWVSGAGPEPTNSPSAQRNYERYLALARAEAQSGNTVAAENYYQHAEHYFRTMSSNRAK
jgi:hypothetical protein